MNAPALLSLAQWLSPAFPTGAFAWSHGLESAIDAGLIADAAALEAWLGDLVAHGSLWQDAVLLSLALRPGADLAALADLGRALATSAERLAETEQQGAALAATISALPPGRAIAAAPLPVAMGAAAATLALPAASVIALYLQAVAGNLLGAAQRLMPLGQTGAQRILASLAVAIEAAAARAAHAEEEDIGAAGIGADLAALAHEVQPVRIFRS